MGLMHTMDINNVRWKQRCQISLCFLTALIFLAGGCAGKREVEESPEYENTNTGTTDRRAAEIEIDNMEEELNIQEAEIQNSVLLEDLTAQIEEAVRPEQEKGSLVAVYVEELSSGDYAVVSDQPMESASLIKLYIAGCAYERMEELKAQESYENETEEMIRLMISVSDNQAANTIVRRLGQGDAKKGMEAVNQFCLSHEYTETSMGRLMLDLEAETDNYTSVIDCGKFLRDIYSGRLAGADSILAYMKQQERIGKIPAGVPEGIVTANKTGELSDVENDAAIVYTDTKDYVICVMTGQLQDVLAGRETVISLSSLVYQYMDNNYQMYR